MEQQVRVPGLLMSPQVQRRQHQRLVGWGIALAVELYWVVIRLLVLP